MSSEPGQTPSRLQSLSTSKEFWLVLGVVMLLTTLTSWLGQLFPLVGQWGALIIALLFIYVPIEVLERRDVSLKELGIWRGRWPQGVRHFLLVSLVVFPPYAACFHYFQTHVEGREANFEVRRLQDWPLEYAPNRANQSQPNGFRIILKGDRIYCRWHLPGAEVVTASFNGDQTLTLREGAVDGRRSGKGLTLSARGSGSLSIETRSSAVDVSVTVDGQPLPAHQMLDGYGQPLDENPITMNRSWWWFFHFLLGQLLLVALPEEVFYRGYLQSRLELRFPKKSRFLGVMISWPALLWTSTIFAIGHILTVPHPARLAVFFPSLLFGWMRSASGSVFSAILFHTACNLFAQIAFKFYL